jgi:hypothetical protein
MCVEGNKEKAGRSPRGRLLVPLALLAGLTGCWAGTKVVPFSPAEQNLTHVAMAYSDAYGKLGRGPKNAEELKPFLKEFGDPEELLVSPNDGEPYVVAWGANPTVGGPTEYKGMFPILAYEKKGKNGWRAITDIRGRPMNIPADDFSQLTFVRGHKPSSD